MYEMTSQAETTSPDTDDPWAIYAPKQQNLCADIEEAAKSKIVNEIKEGLAEDKDSRSEWFSEYRKYMDLVTKIPAETKDFPFKGASNAVVPIMQQAADNFADAASKAVFRGDVVSVKVEGPDEGGEKAARAERVRRFLTHQIESGRYEDDTDAMLSALPLACTVLRKTYWEGEEPKEYFLLPDDFEVSAAVRNLEEAPRITEYRTVQVREIEERIRAGLWERWDFNAETNEHKFTEQHFWFDLDEDGYPEPYCGIVHDDTSTLVRLYANFGVDDVLVDPESGEVMRINPLLLYEAFRFLPSLDGTFYGRGLPHTMGAINRTVNSLVRQLIDAATFQNGPPVMAYRKEAKVRGRKITFQLGKVNVTDIPPDAFYTPPIPQPSVVTLNLLSSMVDSAREIGGLSNVMADLPANMPATTSLAYVEQGSKAFTAQFKRLWRSLSRELNKRMDLNRRYLDDVLEDYMALNDVTPDVALADFQDDLDISPTADPEEATDMQMMARANALLSFRGQGLNDQEITRRALEAMRIPDIDALAPEDTGPPIQVLMIRAQLEMARSKLDAELNKMEAETTLKYAQAAHEISQAEAEEQGRQLDQHLAVVREIRANAMAEIDAMGKMINEQGTVGRMAPGQGDQGIPQFNI